MTELLVMMAVTYITYLIVESAFPPIHWLRELALESPWMSVTYLLTCWWCSGFWVALCTVCILSATTIEVQAPVLVIFASALVAGFTGELVNLIHMIYANLVKDLQRDNN